MKKLPNPYPASKYPWMVQRPPGDPKYYKNFGDALAVVKKDLNSFKKWADRLRVVDAQQAIAALFDQLPDVTPISGGTVTGIVDPYNPNMKYLAHVVRREAMT